MLHAAASSPAETPQEGSTFLRGGPSIREFYLKVTARSHTFAVGTVGHISATSLRWYATSSLSSRESFCSMRDSWSRSSVHHTERAVCRRVASDSSLCLAFEFTALQDVATIFLSRAISAGRSASSMYRRESAPTSL